VADAGVRDAGDAEVRDVGPADGDGTCPAFIPGTWRVTSTEGSTRVGCATRATYDLAPSVFWDLIGRGSCWSDRDAGGGDSGCNLYAIPPCSIERNTGDSRMTFTPVTGSLATGFYGPFPSGCFFNLRAEYIGP
jgi:hypothetical protein